MSGSNWVKFGVSKDPDKRLFTLQCGNPHELSFLFGVWCRKPVELESQLHILNRKRRSKFSREWFLIPPNDLRLMANRISYACSIAEAQRGVSIKLFRQIVRGAYPWLDEVSEVGLG